MTVASHRIDALLERARRRLGCLAAAVYAPSRQIDEISCDADSVPIRATIARTLNSFMDLCRDSNQPVIRNRVRERVDGPLLGKFLVAPISDENGFIGALVAYNADIGPAFTVADGRRAARLAYVLGKTISASRDPLTGLLTRGAFEQQAKSARAAHAKSPCAVLYGDLDQMHVINDRWGFAAGDRAIAIAGKSVQRALAAPDSVLCRLSGDRFTAFIPNCTLARAKQLAETARDAIARAGLTAKSDSIPLSICWGVAALPVGESNFDHAMAAAEIACKAAKDRGRNRVEIYQDADVSIIRRLDDVQMASRLRTALDEGRFYLVAQPIASLLTQERVDRYELLLRLLDEDGETLQPQQFMSAAERYQLLPHLDRCVVGSVLSKLKKAYAQPGFKPIKFALNLSGPTISEPNFIEWLTASLDASGVPGRYLGFELTENAAMHDVASAQALTQGLQARGCEFSLDDFGTGFSSLSYLHMLNPNAIKIDGCFVRNLLDNERSVSLVRAMAQLAHSMGIATVAEYVETPAICVRLIELGVNFGQGHALGKAVPFDDLISGDAKLMIAS